MGAVATTANVVLGIFNAYMLLRARHVSLMVVPTIPLDSPALAEDPDTHEMRIQVVNLSAFPVYIRGVGLEPRDKGSVPIKFIAPADQRFPLELKPRQSIRLLPDENHYMRVSAGRFRCAYAQTACGRTRTGTSPSLQQQELNVFEHTGATHANLQELRRRHIWERIASYIRSSLW